MSVHEIIIIIMAAFAVAGAVDKILGNRLGLGKEFENGILAMGSLAMAMLGIITIAPVLANLLKPVVVPVYQFLGADPAMFAGTFFACDMGGAVLAREMTADPQAALLGGVLAGAMLGGTIVFSIPVAMGILREEDRPAMAKGMLAGFVTTPVGVHGSSDRFPCFPDQWRSAGSQRSAADGCHRDGSDPPGRHASYFLYRRREDW